MLCHSRCGWENEYGLGAEFAVELLPSNFIVYINFWSLPLIPLVVVAENNLIVLSVVLSWGEKYDNYLKPTWTFDK